jgi:hypothetical protein
MANEASQYHSKRNYDHCVNAIPHLAVPTWTPSDNNNPTTSTSIDCCPRPLSEPTAVTSMTNTPVDVIADESNAPCGPKWVIGPRIQSDEAAMDDSDCVNSDCKDPK